MMRTALLLTLSLSCFSLGWAQSAAPAPGAAQQPPATPTTPGEVEKRTERIQIEDTRVRIDELRVGGETKTITVQPKSRLPAYQIEPTSGERSWKILDF